MKHHQTVIATVFAALVVFAFPTLGYSASAPTLEKVVIVMRHGIRPPTKDAPLPPGYTDQTWPKWDVPAGWLTEHGQKAIAQIARFDRNTYSSLLGSGCPTSGQVRIVADTDERTLKTADVYANTNFAGCGIIVENVGVGKSDPRFSPFETGSVLTDDAALNAARNALPTGGLTGLDAANHDRLRLIDSALNCCQAPRSGLADTPTVLSVKQGRVKITGGLDTASTVAQILLLEYADGKPLDQVGWGKITPSELSDLSSLHALEFQLVARPADIAHSAARALLGEVEAAFTHPSTAKFTVLVGHDSNLAYVGGALGLHWQASGFAADDPPPGGAIIFELWKNADGQEFVQFRFRSSSLDEMRNLTGLSVDDSRPMDVAGWDIAGCETQTRCSLDAFKRLTTQ